jgi:hypothetical protein
LSPDRPLNSYELSEKALPWAVEAPSRGGARVWIGMRKSLMFLLQGCPSGPCLVSRVCLLAATVLLATLIVSTHSGCAETKAGLDREGAVLGVATNVAPALQAAVRTTGAPLQPFADCAVAIIAAALAAWNTSHSRRLRALETEPAAPGEAKAKG